MIKRFCPFAQWPHLCRRGILIGVCSLNLQWIDVAFSQRALSSFGPCTERPLDFIPAGVAVREHPRHGKADIAVLVQERPLIRFFSVSDQGRIEPAGSAQLPNPQRVILASDIDGDGESEFVTISSTGSEVGILKKWGDTYREQTIPLEVKAQRAVIADINNDGAKDILLFGKSMTGVMTLLGGKRHTFAPGPLLFPEISVSDLKTIDLNGDGITDVILLNWLSNELVLFYGISRDIFSEQLTIPMPGEPADLALTETSDRRMIRIGVTLPAEKRTVILEGLVAGEFVVRDSIPLPGRPAGVQFALVNDDGLPDIVASTDRGMAVSLALAAGEYATPTVFGLGSAGRAWTVADVDGDRKNDLVVADRSGRRLVVVANAERGARVSWPDVYAVGSSPHGVALLDCNRDGRNDIVVANSGSSSLSVLLNEGNGKMLGQQSLTLPEGPSTVVVASTEPGVNRVLVTSHPTRDKIAVVELGRDLARTDMFAIPTDPHPFVLDATDHQEASGLEVLVRSKSRKNGSVSLSLFEELSGRQFLERSLKANLPNRITALTVSDFLGNGSYDLVFATNDAKSKTSTLFLASGSTKFSFKTAHRLFEYPDSLSSTCSIISGFLDGDPHRDILVVLGPPRNAFAVGYGAEGGTIRDSLVWVEGVHPIDDDEIVLHDFNNDGRVDIAFLDADRKALVALYGMGRGRFSAPEEVCPAPGADSFAIGSLRSATTEDVVLSHTKKGSVSIVFSPFQR